MPDGRDPLVGRDTELAVLRRAVDDALVSGGRVVLVCGEAGIGKTRLVAEAGTHAAGRGAAVAWGPCVPQGSAFWPWRRALRALDIDGVLLTETPEGHSDARLRAFEAVAELLCAAAEKAPVVIVLDDLQWADVPSLRFLGFVVRAVSGLPILLLGTFRDAEVGPDHPLNEVIGQLAGAVSVLPLGGLDVGAVGRILGPERAGFAAQVKARTGGNPFFVREVAHLLDHAETVPPAVRQVIGKELSACSPECREALAAAAVATSIDVALLARVLDRPPAALAAPLEEARARRFVEAGPAGDRFRHDLVRETVLSALAPARRAELHWACGLALAASGDPAQLADAALHLRTGVAAGDVDQAVAVAVSAARGALAGLAFEPAAGHLDWSLQQIRQGAALPPGEDDVELALLLGDARLRSGDWDGAGDVFEHAASMARAEGRSDQLARAAIGFGAGLGGFEVRLVDARQITLLEEAARATAGRDSVMGAYVLARLSVALSFVDEPARRAALAREARDMAARTGNAAAQAHALAAWCDVISGPDHTEERLGAAAEIVRLGREAQSDEQVLAGHRFAVVAHLELGDLAGAEREMVAFERLASRYRVPIVTWYVPLWRGMRALLRGDLTSAERLADEAAEIGARAGSQNAFLLSNTLRLATFVSRGAVPEEMSRQIRDVVPAALADNPGLCSARAVLLTLAIADGSLDEVRHHLDTMVAFGFGEVDAEWLGVLSTSAVACAALGDAELADLVADRLLPYSGRFVVDGIGAALLGSVDEYLGGLDLVRGRRVAGEDRLRRAAARYDDMGATLLAARARSHWGASPAVGRRPEPERASLRRDGDTWVATYRQRAARVKDAKGLHDLAELLARPGREVHVSELAGTGASPSGGAGDGLIDDRAKAAYRRRIAELEGEVADARDDNDIERAARAQEELELLVDELGRALGLGGRSRRARDDHERARGAVRARLRWAIDRITAEHPELGRHLDVSIRTGAFCAYQPDRPVDWDIAT